MSGFKLIDHTSDIGIAVSGKTLKELYINAAKGVVDMCVCHSRPRLNHSGVIPAFAGTSGNPVHVRVPHFRGDDKTIRNVTISALDREQLLVKWLQEVLFLINAKQFVPLGFKILSLTKKTLKAHVSYIPFDAQLYEIKREVKAATYHGLSIKKSGGQFRASVILDI